MTYLPMLAMAMPCIVAPLSMLIWADFWCRISFYHRFPLAKIPGPRIAAWTRFWIVKVLASGRAPEIWSELNEKYGSLARIGPNHVITDDPDTMKRVLGGRAGYRRGSFFKAIKTDALLDNIASVRDPEQHAAMRAGLAPHFRGSSLSKAEASIDKVVLTWTNQLRSTCARTSTGSCVVDLARKIQYLTIDVVTKFLCGSALGCVATDSDMYGFFGDISKAISVVQYFSVITELNTVLYLLSNLPCIGKIFRAGPSNHHGAGRLLAFLEDTVNDRKDTGPHDDMIGSMLKKGKTAREISSELMVSLVAGSDTTATLAQYTMLAIMTNPQAYHTLKAEINNCLSTRTASEVVQFSEYRQMPYLHACVMEGLRKFPPVSQLREREVGEGGDFLNGHFVPEGTKIGLNVRGLQRRKDIFGDDTSIFRPDRWFESDEGKLKKMRLAVDLAFGYGGYKCLGYNIAMMAAHKIVFEMMRNLDVAIAQPNKPWESSCHWVFVQKNFNVVLTPVQPMAPPAYSPPPSPTADPIGMPDY